MSKRLLFLVFSFFFVLATAWAQDTRYEPKGPQIPGPATSADFPKWLADIQHWRMEHRIRIGYDDAESLRPENIPSPGCAAMAMILPGTLASHAIRVYCNAEFPA